MGLFRAIYSALDKEGWERGIESLKKALYLATEIHYPRLVYSCNVNLAEACLGRDKKTAREHLSKAKLILADVKVDGARAQIREFERRLASEC